MKLFNYETNVKYNNGLVVVICGKTKQELQKYFKDLGVVIGKRTSPNNITSIRPTNYLEAQKQLLIKYLKLKKVYIEKEEVFKDEKSID